MANAEKILVNPKYYKKYRGSILFIIILFIMPRSLALDVGDSIPLLTIQRIFIAIFLLIYSKSIFNNNVVKVNAPNIVLFLFLITSFISTFMNPTSTSISGLFSIIFEYLGTYFIVYHISQEMGVIKVVEVIQKCILFICVMGIIEFALQYNIFSLLITNNRAGFNLTPYYRNDVLRIAGPFVHSLGYSSFICLYFPIMAYDTKKQNFNLSIKNMYFLLPLVNLLLTQSRSSWFVVFFEILLILGAKKIREKLKYIFIGFGLFLIVLGITYSFPSLIISKLVMMILVLFTGYYFKLSSDFGGNINPFAYRRDLLDLLEKPESRTFFGNGLGWVRNNYLTTQKNNSYGVSYTMEYISIDNFYISHILQVGYIGSLSIVLMFVVFCGGAYKQYRKYNNNLFKSFFIAMLGYFVQLLSVDDLGYLYLLFVIFALYSCLRREKNGRRT